MKYQIILETKEITDDGTFERGMKTLFKTALPHWKVVMARSLDGIRPEVVPFLEDDLADIL